MAPHVGIASPTEVSEAALVRLDLRAQLALARRARQVRQALAVALDQPVLRVQVQRVQRAMVAQVQLARLELGPLAPQAQQAHWDPLV